MAPGYRLHERSKRLPSTMSVSSSLERRTIRPTGGLVAATSRPWYRRVFNPVMVEEANPPIPLVSSHSSRLAASRLRQTDSSNWLMPEGFDQPVHLRSCLHLRHVAASRQH